MKRMIDKSKMSGVKILGEFKFVDNGACWAVYKEINGAYIYQYTTSKIYKESNINLYNSVKEKM
jgi:hypothetical protein